MDRPSLQWAVAVLIGAGIAVGGLGYWSQALVFFAIALLAVIICYVNLRRTSKITADEWLELAEHFRSIFEEHVLVVWRRPIDSERRQWYFVGEKRDELTVVAKRAAKMLENSGRKINEDMPPHVRAEKDSVSRWFELVASGNVIAVGDDDKDGFIRGRFVGAITRSVEMCERIAGMLP